VPHDTPLLATIAMGLGLAFVFGFLAARLRLPPIVGYLVAGIVAGPFTPGFTADAMLATQLAEIGVILLMFGVGLHFSIQDLLDTRRVALPGAIAQIVTATFLGAVVAHFWGWSWSSGFIYGLSLSVASTIVLVRALEERGMLDSVPGRIAVGWVVVEDLVTVLALVLLPALAGALGGTPQAEARYGLEGVAGGAAVAVVITMAKVVAFVALMIFVGARVVPWILAVVARTGSRELFMLAVLAVALGLAFGAASLFGVSFALGAFFAGVVITESDMSHQAAAEALPLRDAFAVLFFVSVGMLFDPSVVVRSPLAVLATVMIVIVGKTVVAVSLVLLLGRPLRTALTVSASLAQIGEFSFVLAGLGVALGLLPPEGRDLMLAGALISIVLNPLVFAGATMLERWARLKPDVLDALERKPEHDTLVGGAQPPLREHVVMIGFGRVGETIGRAFDRESVRYLIVEQNREIVDALRARGLQVLFGDAGRPGILEHAALPTACLLVIASPGAYQTRHIIRLARDLNPDVEIVVRTHSESERRHLESIGVSRAVVGERELALGMTRYALRSLGVPADEADAVVQAVRTEREETTTATWATFRTGPTGARRARRDAED
jgi:monovalent cation:H+ antiporter-2, CPA2 family